VVERKGSIQPCPVLLQMGGDGGKSKKKKGKEKNEGTTRRKSHQNQWGHHSHLGEKRRRANIGGKGRNKSSYEEFWGGTVRGERERGGGKGWISLPIYFHIL